LQTFHAFLFLLEQDLDLHLLDRDLILRRDGFTLRLDSSGARRVRTDEGSNRGFAPSSYTLLPPGSSRSSDGYTCTSRASGLTCSSTSGAGWVLPRYRGLPQLF